jgi:hypothetical protein
MFRWWRWAIKKILITNIYAYIYNYIYKCIYVYINEYIHVLLHIFIWKYIYIHIYMISTLKIGDEDKPLKRSFITNRLKTYTYDDIYAFVCIQYTYTDICM